MTIEIKFSGPFVSVHKVEFGEHWRGTFSQYERDAFLAAVGNEPVPYPVDWVWSEPLPIPKPNPPSSVSMRQARHALLEVGLLDTVDSALRAIPGVEGRAALIDWEFATTVERESSLVKGMSYSLGFTSDQLDALFLSASQCKA